MREQDDSARMIGLHPRAPVIGRALPHITEERTLSKIPPGVGPQYSQVVVLVGATGDLAHRKLLPGLFYLSRAGFIPGCRIIGVSLDNIDADGFRKSTRAA